MMIENNTHQLFLTVFLSAGAGTALVEVIIRLIFEHWLTELRYKHRIKNADKRGCAKELLDLINPKHFKERLDLKNDIYNNDYALSDRLETLGEKKFSQKLDLYSASYKHLASLNSTMFKLPIPSDYKETQKEFLDTLSKIDELRNDLLNIAKRLKN